MSEAVLLGRLNKIENEGKIITCRIKRVGMCVPKFLKCRFAFLLGLGCLSVPAVYSEQPNERMVAEIQQKVDSLGREALLDGVEFTDDGIFFTENISPYEKWLCLSKLFPYFENDPGKQGIINGKIYAIRFLGAEGLVSVRVGKEVGLKVLKADLDSVWNFF